MAQGQIKGLQKQKGSGGRHAAKAAAAPKKGKRYIAPKKAAAVKQAALHKVSSFLHGLLVRLSGGKGKGRAGQNGGSAGDRSRTQALATKNRRTELRKSGRRWGIDG